MEPIARTFGQTDWITITLVVSLLFPIIAKSIYYPRFLNFIILPFNNKYISTYTKKEKLFNWFHFLMSVFQVINTTLFIFFYLALILQSYRSKKPVYFSFTTCRCFLIYGCKNHGTTVQRIHFQFVQNF